MNLNPNDPQDARPLPTYSKYNYLPSASSQKQPPPSTLPVSYPPDAFPHDFSGEQRPQQPLHVFDINESQILNTSGGHQTAHPHQAPPQLHQFDYAGARHMVGLGEEMSPLKVASSQDLFETEADLNVNQDLLKNSADQSSIASALRVARPDAPTPSRTEESEVYEAQALDEYLVSHNREQGAPNQLKPIVFHSFDEENEHAGSEKRGRFSQNPCTTPHSPSTFMQDLRMNSSVLSQLGHEECKFCVVVEQGGKGRSLKSVMRENLNSKYLTSRDFYNVKIINDIIYNECTHIVSVFKDFLIYDDISEFLKRFYQSHETKSRLPKIFEFYDKYSKVFPNYVILLESKYMFKNIERKQRAIDEKNQQLVDMDKRKPPRSLEDLDATDENRLFSTRFINSVNQIKKLGMSSSLAKKGTTTEKSMSVHLQHRKDRPLEEMPLDQLVEKFLAKDSELFINPDDPGAATQEEKKRAGLKGAYPKPKITGFGGNLKTTASEMKGAKKPGGQIAKSESKNGGLLNLNIYNNYNQYINENYYQAQTVNVHHNNYGTQVPQLRTRAARHETQPDKEEERKPYFAAGIRKSTDVQKEERPTSKENLLRAKGAFNIQATQQSGLARTTSRPYLHQDPKTKTGLKPNTSNRPGSSHAVASGGVGKITPNAQIVSATSRPLSGSASSHQFQTYQIQPQPAFGSTTATRRLPENGGAVTPRGLNNKGAAVIRKERTGVVREGRKNSLQTEYEAQYQEYLNEYAKKKEQKAMADELHSKRQEQQQLFQKKVIPQLKLEELGHNFVGSKTPSLSPNSARAARTGLGFEFMREEQAATARGIITTSDYALKRGVESHSSRRNEKSGQRQGMPAYPTTAHFFTHQHVAHPYHNIQQITANHKGSSMASSQGTVGSIRSEQELSGGGASMGPIPEIKPASGSQSARGAKPGCKRPSKLKSTDLAASSTTATTRRSQYGASKQQQAQYQASSKSPGINSIGYKVRPGSHANVTSGSVRSKGELTAGELSYGSSKENQPSTRTHLLQSTPKNTAKPKEGSKFATGVPSTYEHLHYQTPLHLTSSASRSARGGSVSSSSGSQQPVGHYNQVPNVASKMTASVLAKRQPSVRGASSSSTSSTGSQRGGAHHSRSKGDKPEMFGSGHYGGFYNRQSFGQLGGGGYATHYNYQQPQLEHPANQHYHGIAGPRDVGGQNSARAGHYDYLMSSSSKPSLLTRQSPYEVKVHSGAHYQKTAQSSSSTGPRKKMSYSKSVENLGGGKAGVRSYQAQVRAGPQAAMAEAQVHSLKETKFLKALEQKTNQFLKAHNSREKFFTGPQQHDLSTKNEDLKYTNYATKQRYQEHTRYPKHNFLK